MVASIHEDSSFVAAPSGENGETAPPISAAPVASPPPTNLRRVIAMTSFPALTQSAPRRLLASAPIYGPNVYPGVEGADATSSFVNPARESSHRRSPS